MNSPLELVRLTTQTPAPPGFCHVQLHKRHLIGGPVALLIDSLDEIAACLPNFDQRMQGILITPRKAASSVPAQSARATLPDLPDPTANTATTNSTDAAQGTLSEASVPYPNRLGPLLWHVELTLPLNAGELALLDGWLIAQTQTDQAQTESHVANTRSERQARELESIRYDYHEVTGQLLKQVDHLLDAQNELSRANQELESRVARRTSALAEANAHLSKALQDLQQTQSELVRSAQLAGLGSLVAGIAHELNTPIGNALTVATSLHFEAHQLHQMVMNGTLKRSALERHAQSAERITLVMEKNLKRAAEIIGHFKQLAIDQVSEKRRRFPLSEVISDTLSALSPRLSKTTHQIELRGDDTLEMDSYPGAISQVLTNFIINALVHGFEHHTHGMMTLQTRAKGDLIELTFSDDGKGIPEPDLSRVFDPFFTTKLGQGGSGLGMHISYNLVTAILGGKIDIQSTLGLGTTITLLLPRSAPEVKEQAT